MKKSKTKSKKVSATKVVVPFMFQSTKTIKAYLATLPEEERAKLQMGTTLEVAEHAGANQRISFLVSAFYHIHSIQALLQADIEILMDNWGLWLKGVRPAMTNVQQSSDKFIRIMSEIFSVGRDKEEKEKDRNYYAQDIDSLYKKFMRWEALPITWEPGQEQRTNFIKSGEEKGKDETLVIDNDIEWVRIGAIDVPAIQKDYRADLPEVYCVGEMMDDETVQMGKKPYRTISTARGVASKYAAAEPGKVFIIYKRTNQWHYRPVEFKSEKK